MLNVTFLLNNLENEGVINQFISFCNDNQGFMSAILSVCSLMLSVVATAIALYNLKLPYKKQLGCIGGLYVKNGEIVGDIEIVNCGNRPIMIKNVNIFRHKSRLWVGRRIKSHIIKLMPGDMKKVPIRIFDDEELIEENLMNLNPFIFIEIVDTENKSYRFKNHFGIG